MADTDALIEQLVKDAAPVKRARHPYAQCAKWLVGLVAYMAVLLLFFHVRPDIMVKLKAPLFLAETGALALIAVTSALSAALLSYPDLMQKKAVAVAPVGAFGVFIAVMAAAWLADNPPAPQPAHEMACTVCMTLFSLLPAIWIFTTLRKSASTHAAYAGITATLCAFSIGALTLRLSEMTDSISHVAQWHYAPMFAMSITGLWLGKMILKW